MSMASLMKKAGLFLALLLVIAALPGWSEDTPKPSSDATSASSPDDMQQGSDAADQTRKPAPAPAPAQAPAAPAAQSPAAPAPAKAAPAPAPAQSKAAPAQAPASPIQTPKESPTPPTNLHKVGNHWTPYEPPDPESFPEGAQVHIIVNGDNLWNLANTQFQNPWLWPQIWNENRYILDSHWIYPGDPLILPPRPTVVSEILPASGQTAPPLPTAPEAGPKQEAPASAAEENEIAEAGPEGMENAPPESAPEPHSESLSADHSDIYCTGEIRHDAKKTEIYIANEEQEGKIGLTEGDLVYLNRGRQGDKVHPGDVFQVIVKEEEVFHPMTDKWLGTYVRRAGRVKVLAVQENTAIAQVTESCGDRVEVGYELEPFQEIPVPAMKEVPFNRLDVEPSGNSNGYVVHVESGRNQAFTGNVLDVDLGSRDGLKPGDILQVYLNNTPPAEQRVKYNYKWGSRRYESQELRTDDRDLLFPRKPIGQLLVLTTGEKTATAKIVYAIREIEVGNPVEVR
jgi:LysM domain-containing protein